MAPTRTQVILCWLLFTAAMALLSWALHAYVPPVMTSLQDAFGIGTVGILMLIGWLVLAFFGYRPLLRNWLARRRSARIRQR
ncbi:hypothetical protein [Methylobacterium radiotolerans]|uniref:hypothetical protein n=1 Tax=Methylobacterium radiotolerans TaxID=31998 RepID=UPI000D5D7D6D|nr:MULTISPECIES: hypothetical protein [Methylobacterium]MDE3749389.1 hypothetical protein [Methylobacterium radiotolerans]PVY97938.1 hypothetical protein C7388_112192 [Methylobacterium organophilum]